MALSRQMVVILGIALLTTQTVLSYDPPILTDFGLVGATSGANFTSTAFRTGPKAGPGELQLVQQTQAQFPGVTGLGISSLLFVAGAGAFVPPHTHPRATEIFFVLSGNWSVGFIDTTYTLFSSDLVAGDQFIFPVSLIHYQFVTGTDGGTGASVFNSANPGLQVVGSAIFESNPSVPDFILTAAFNTSTSIIDSLKASLA